MKTIKTTILISILLILTTSCTDLTTEDLVPETKTENTELTTETNNDTIYLTNSLYTGDGTGSDNGSGKEN